MLDPLPSPPAFIQASIKPLADKIGLPLITLHIHEILLAFLLYHYINVKISPALSRKFFPNTYPHLNTRTKTNWDIHVVSLAQSIIITVLALWVIWFDDDRKLMGWRDRVWGYTGSSGMVQGFAAGYFLWDLMVSSTNIQLFGWGLLAHAICALVVFTLGFKPFVNYYAPTFILYEASSPFLNIHWFFDKVNMTGSRWQLINGIALLVTFFLCRLVWGTYQSLRVYQDVWAGLYGPGPTNSERESIYLRFAGEQRVPLWLALTYLGANCLLNTLNFYWFGKMIETVRKRFRAPKGKGEKMAVSVREDGTSTVAVDKDTQMDGDTRKYRVEEMEVRRRKE